MTAVSECVHCHAICEPGFNTCSQECNLAYRKDGPKIEDSPEGYFTLSDLARQLGLSYSKLYFCVNKGRGRHVLPKGGKYSLEEVAKLGITPATSVAPVEEKVFPLDPSSSQRELGDSVDPPELCQKCHRRLSGCICSMTTPELKTEKKQIESEIAKITTQLPNVIRERMLSAAKAAARDACLEAADEAKKAGDQWLRAQCLEDYLHIEEGLKMVFNGRA